MTAGPATRAVGIDRPHVGTHQAGAPLRLVHGGDAQFAEQPHHIGIGPFDAAPDDGLHDERVRHLRIDALVGLGEADAAAARVAHRLHAAPLAEIGVVMEQVLLRGHRFHRLPLLLPHRRDVQQHLRLEVALLGLMRFEQEDGRRVVLAALALGGVAGGLRVDASLQRQVVRHRMVGIVRVFVAVGEDDLGFALAKFVHHVGNFFRRGNDRIVAHIEEADLRAENFGGARRFGVAIFLHALDGHAIDLPQALGFAAFAVGEAEDPDAIAAFRVERDGAAGAPDEVGGMRADYEHCLFVVHDLVRSSSAGVEPPLIVATINREANTCRIKQAAHAAARGS